jgi:5-methylcytosine-specific restriction enzyme subunit McrC
VNIPIQNIYFLLCYAWDKLDEREVVAVDPLSSTSLADLFARVLINGTKHVLKRGFDRGYVSHHEQTSRLRGRIDFQEAIRTNSTLTCKLPCDFDELTYNVLHNRILKTTMLRLLRRPELATENSEALAQFCRIFSDIKEIDLTNRVFGQVQLHRNNHFYDFLLKVCELIHRNLLASEAVGSSKFMDFVRDRQQMAILFENFVRIFYRVHTHFTVKRENIAWQWEAADADSHSLLPKMQTDISLTSPARRIIIDCKFTPEATQSRYESEKLRSSHLYQINSYMTNLMGDLADRCEMILLYPTVESTISATFSHNARKIGIRTINLDQPWQQIHDDLLAIVA